MIEWILITIILICLFGFYVETYSDNIKSNDVLLVELASQIHDLDPKFKNIQIREGSKSYTINKRYVYICLKDKFGRYYPRNHLIYVICHELAHVNCPEIGHTDAFKEEFRKLLERAYTLGIYDPSVPPIRNYCGHH